MDVAYCSYSTATERNITLTPFICYIIIDLIDYIGDIDYEHLVNLFDMQTTQPHQSPDGYRQEPGTSVEQPGKDAELQPVGHCSREVQVTPPPTANHNQAEVAEDDAFGNSRMYLSG